MRKEQIKYEAVIAADNQPEPTDYCISARADHWNGFVEGFEAGAKWADEHPDWIPVDQEMPPRNEENNRFSIYVQVIDKYGWQETDWYDFEKNEWKISDANYVTHWKYLSAPPEGTKSVPPRYKLNSIYDAQDGDIVFYETHYDEMSYIIIFESLYRRNEYEPAEGINYYLLYCPEEEWFDQEVIMYVPYYDINRFKPATDEQKQLLFDALKKYGYEWDSKNKKINKICTEN